MFGIGGAPGEGTAAKAGYMSMPEIVACQVCHAVPNTFAITFEYLSCCGVFFGACDRMSGVSGGPTTPPGVSVPTTALMTTPLMAVVVIHWEIAPQIASHVPSM